MCTVQSVCNKQIHRLDLYREVREGKIMVVIIRFHQEFQECERENLYDESKMISFFCHSSSPFSPSCHAFLK